MSVEVIALVISGFNIAFMVYQYKSFSSNRKFEVLNESCLLAAKLDVKVKSYEKYLLEFERKFDAGDVRFLEKTFIRSGMIIDKLMNDNIDTRKYSLKEVYELQNELLKINREVHYHSDIIEKKMNEDTRNEALESQMLANCTT